MPIYTYRCENCGIQFEKQQKFSDQPLTRCPECSKNALRKVYLPVGIVFKGSGFYATDNRSPSGASRTSGSKSEESDKSEKSEKTSDSKSSEKSENSSPSSSDKKD
jgi:putative FmdB family regulatory protein